jgi:calcium-dependent protein kinase
MEKVSKGQFSFSGEEWTAVTAEAKKLIKRMLEYEPFNRISAEDALNDSWIKRYTGKVDIDKPLAVNALTNLKNFRVNLSHFIVEQLNILI